MKVRFPLWLAIFGLAAGSARAQLSEILEATGATTESVKLVFRHEIEYDRRAGVVSWKTFDANMEKYARFTASPGSFDLRTSESQPLELKLELDQASFVARPQRRADASWSIPFSFALGPREVVWKDPPLTGSGLSANGNARVELGLPQGPLWPVAEADVRGITVGSFQAGIYRARDLTLKGRWNRPNWQVDELKGELFGGRIDLRGSGKWGTDGPPRVSIELTAEEIDLPVLLEAFKIPRASQIRAKVTGRARIEADGREWKAMELDLKGEEGTVFLDRQLIYDILAPSIGGALTLEQVQKVLDDTFGNERMIPFREMSFGGSLTPETLNLKLPLKNQALGLFIEPRIEVPILWEIWDDLLDTGIKNVGGVRLTKEPSAKSK